MKASRQRPAMSIACRALCLLAIALLIPESVLADIVALKNGTRLQGVVANRELIATNPQQVDHVAILIDDTQEYKTILAADIDFVLLVDGEQRRLIEFTPVIQTPLAPAPSAKPETLESDKKGAGIGALVFGSGLAVFGALVKFGGEKVIMTDSELTYEEHTYNTANYVVIVGGAILAVVGIALIAAGPEKADDTKNAFLELREEETRVGIAVGF